MIEPLTSILQLCQAPAMECSMKSDFETRFASTKC